MQTLLTPKEIQNILKLGKSPVYRLLASGEIPCVRVAKGTRKSCWRVDPVQLEKWLKKNEIRNG